MNDDDNINDYLPSLLNPRVYKKQLGDFNLTQNSIVSRCSLSLRKRRNDVTPVWAKNKLASPNQEINNNVPAVVEVHDSYGLKRKYTEDRGQTNSVTEDLFSVVAPGKENQFTQNIQPRKTKQITHKQKTIEDFSIGFSAIDDLNTIRNCEVSSPFSFSDLEPPIEQNKPQKKEIVSEQCNKIVENNKSSLKTLSSATELSDKDLLDNTQSTIAYELIEEPAVNVTFGVKNCDTVNISAKHSSIVNILVTRKESQTLFDCEMIENAPIEISDDEDDLCGSPSPPKKLAVAVSLEIKKQKSPEENSKVLILKSDAIERLTHIIVQPPNYKLVKRKISNRNKFKKNFAKARLDKNEKVQCSLKQRTIDSYLCRDSDTVLVSLDESGKCGDVCDDMSRKPGVADTIRVDRHASRSPYKKDDGSPARSRPSVSKGEESPRPPNSRSQQSADANRIRAKPKDSLTSNSPRKNVDSMQFSLSSRRSTRTAKSPKPIPHYKVIQGTHFAVDAFSYGEIPQVKHYFLTHFHSDHYAGLKKGFNKALYCSKITADLCVVRLGVSSRHIHVINLDEPITIDGVEITAVDANHCPGAIMLLFTLPNGKTMLHTGDLRASPLMESYPVFWNKDIHTIYLDTTYCNPRYDFPTQDQSLEMALFHLRQKKLSLEKVGKKFSSVLIVCGTYTIGKEKFFLGMARRVGCSVWACPEKDKVLQIVEGRTFSHSPPQSCQLHVVPMRDLTHEKLRAYLDGLQGTFSEVVAFKPSGWENGKNSSVEKDSVTIHGIPYSEHSSFSEMIRFVKFLKPQQVVPTVDISGGVKAVQKYFPCPLVAQEETLSQSRVTDFFSIGSRQQHSPAVT